MSYLAQYIEENLKKILSWSAESSHSFQIEDLVEWFTKEPECSSFRVNTLKYTSEEVVECLKRAFADKYNGTSVALPKIKIHTLFPECVIISKVDTNSLDVAPKTAEVIVDSDCGVAVLRGSDVFAPGVLNITPRVTVGTKVSVYADLEANCLQGSKQYYTSDGKLFLGNGIVSQTRFQIFESGKKPSGVAVEMTDPVSGVSMVKCPSDFGILQNVPSMVCVRVLDPKPGETVLDMCAAPGNKTTHIATLMNDEGTLIAIDRKSRIKLIVENCSKLGIHDCIRVFAGDSTRIDGSVKVADVTAGPPFSVESFDRVLLDAACSGSGNRPMLKNRIITERMIKSFPKIQKSLLANAVPLLKRGGTLVYSTCSVLCEENECVVAWLLENYPEMELVEAVPMVGGSGLPNCGLDVGQRNLVQRFGPITRAYDSIAFFIAKFKKRE